MILPIGDAPNPRGVPYATNLLIALNVAVYLLVTLPLSLVAPDPRDPAVHEYIRTLAPALPNPLAILLLRQNLSQYDLFVFAHGFRPADPSLLDLLASLFLHAGLMHLAGNMLFLWIYGDNVEHRLGAGRYLLAYLGAGVAASLFHAFFAAGSPFPTIGASGAISGVLGFYFVWFPRNRVRLLWLFPPFFMNVFFVPARLVLGLYLIADNLLPFLFASRGTGVAYGAHIGGFLAGLAAAWALERQAVAKPPREYGRVRTTAPAGAEAARRRIAEKLAAGQLSEAAVEYFSLPAGRAQRVLAPEEAMELAAWLRRSGHPEAALTILRRYLRDYPTGPRLADAHAAAGRILLEDLGEPTAAYQHFLDALGLDPEPEVAWVAREGIRAIEALQKLRIGRPRSFRRN